jgi:hypothetical protein
MSCIASRVRSVFVDLHKRNFSLDRDYWEYWKALLAGVTLPFVRNDPSCKENDAHDKLSYLSLRTGEPLPTCTAFYPSYVAQVGWFNTQTNSDKIVIIRQFYTDLCPAFTPEHKLNAQWQPLNAFVVQKLGKDEWMNRDVVACSLSLPRHAIPGTGGITEMSPHKYIQDDAYRVKRIYRDEKCGIPVDPNAHNAYVVEFLR